MPGVWTPKYSSALGFLRTCAEVREQVGQPLSAGTSSASNKQRARAEDGIKYLAVPVTKPKSAYHPPSILADQQDWEDWFAKLVMCSAV
jgi:hypothetical protein